LCCASKKNHQTKSELFFDSHTSHQSPFANKNFLVDACVKKYFSSNHHYKNIFVFANTKQKTQTNISENTMHTEFLTQDLCETILSFFPATKLAHYSIQKPEINPTMCLCEEDYSELESILTDENMPKQVKTDKLVELALRQPLPLIHNLRQDISMLNLFKIEVIDHLAIFIRHAKYMQWLRLEGCSDCTPVYQFLNRACPNLKTLILVYVEPYPYPFKGNILTIPYTESLVNLPSFKVVEDKNNVMRLILWDQDDNGCEEDQLRELYKKFEYDEFETLILNRLVHRQICAQHYAQQDEVLKKYIGLCEQMTCFDFSASAWVNLTKIHFFQPLYQFILKRIKACESEHSAPGSQPIHIISDALLRDFLEQKEYDTLFKMKRDGIAFCSENDLLWEPNSFNLEDFHFLVHALDLKPPSMQEADHCFVDWIRNYYDTNLHKTEAIDTDPNLITLSEIVFECSKTFIHQEGVSGFVQNVSKRVLSFLLVSSPDILKHKRGEWIESFSTPDIWTPFIHKQIDRKEYAPLSAIIKDFPETGRSFVIQVVENYLPNDRPVELENWLSEHKSTANNQASKRRLEEREDTPSKKQKLEID
jgi:hypothetical protein